MPDPRRATPRTDQVLADERLVVAAGRLGPGLVKQAVARAQEQCRAGDVAPEDVADVAVASLPESASSLRRVLNATGVVVHTNLGRAPLSEAAVEAVRTAAGATDVELDLATGRRGRRGRRALDALGAAVPDAGGVHVVNNGAAALALVTRVLARGDDGRDTVVIARGELVEIGDGFRIPELMESVGARLREVGTTNRVHLRDYTSAVDDTTAFVLKVHPSNFAVTGFASSVPARELAGITHAGRRVPLVVDIGSGLLAHHPRLPDEPDAAGALRAGADLVTASGDKLLGGPQAGLLLGEAGLVERLRRDPFARALRVDKLTLAALEATLAGPLPPVPAALGRSAGDLRARAQAVVAAWPADVVAALDAEVVDSAGAVGGGGAPGVELPSAAISLPERLAAPLRAGDPPVLGRTVRGRLLLDLLALDPADDATLADAVRRVAGADRP
ncbi:L-seryl-tRNA(Sec) selenium transferase [Nocardioides sp. zg-1228]|uniref:L-seryl-tRNA(Sec) selenium transferase n=1 Tax=Nocardioides sp. zg-1228 TaxID=2763008 RepID=UPI0016434242|nr:L-seryl-tRNA(Sec) selenium transferase [Nocardioides sp. zg-1228]MBC2932191.1 L-seryl-tRNA(Sec) selenium transferase [Nocardioides sp. zg-1228]QSF57728.1 L-seryl-tRNA(Sec) selenium transferase [Nocardioides sp. zg-1228]